jgi:hypothetical protein
MKKLALAVAIAAAANLSTSAYALISSNITAIQIISAGYDMTKSCATTTNPGFTDGLVLTGVTPGTAVNLTGQACLDPGAGIDIALNFALSGTGGTGGTIFNAGSIIVFTDFGSGWTFAYNIDAAVTTIDCTTTAGTGLLWTATPGTNTLPGAASPPLPGTPTNGVCYTTLFGSIFLAGTNTWTP